MTKIDPVILGHNPLFGVNHLAQDQGAIVAERMEQDAIVLDLLRHCHNFGIRGMMMSTHPRAADICRLVHSEPGFRDTWRFYPLVPYIQKYVRQANEKGLINVVFDTLGQATWSQQISLLLRGGAGLVTKDVLQALRLLIDVELLPFRGMNLGAVFLHDALTDLAIGLGVESLLDVFRDHVESHHQAIAGFATKNLPVFIQRMASRGLDRCVVMASFNAAGFYVNPSLTACEQAVRQPGLRLLAMSTLACGALAPEDAYRYLAAFPNVESVVVGTSRKDHAAQTMTAIRHHLKFAT